MHSLQCNCDPIQTVGDLNGYRIEVYPTGLLHVGELGDLLPIEPHFPAQSPGSDRRLLPVVLHEADIMFLGVDADRLQGIQIDLLWIARVRLEDHLELVMLLHAVGIFPVPAIIRTNTGFDIGHVPGFGTEYAQQSSWIHRPCTDLAVVRLPDQASQLCPKLLQGHDNRLEIMLLSHH